MTPPNKRTKRTAIDTVKKWLKKNCTKGERVLIQSGPGALVITKGPFFTYSDATPTKKRSKRV